MTETLGLLIGMLLSVGDFVEGRAARLRRAVGRNAHIAQVTAKAQMGHVLVQRRWGPIAAHPFWRQPERLYEACVLIAALAVAVMVVRTPIGWGDYGQWLMLSRHYLGESIPDYRQASAVPPVMPALLAAVWAVLRDPLIALAAFKGLLALSLVGSAYAVGGALFRSRASGLIAVVSIVLVTDRFLELFAFGGLPQLTGLVFMNLGVAAFAWAGAQPTIRMEWWLLGTIGVSLALFSHVGTGMAAVGSGIVVAGISVLRIPGLSWRKRARALTPLALAMPVLALYWLIAVLPANLQYAQNPASLDYRGPDRIWVLLRAHAPNIVLVLTGTALLVGGALHELSIRRLGGFVMAAAWTLSPWGLLASSVLIGAATDYPRFIPVLLAPFVAASGGLAVLTAQAVTFFREEFHGRARLLLPVGLAVLVALNFGPDTVVKYRQEASFYQMNALPELAEGIARLDERLPAGEAILAETREAKWVEGLTGRPALFFIPVRFSFRTAELARGLAAETLLRSRTSISSGTFFIRFLEAKSGLEGDVPGQPWIAANHRGEYVDLVRLMPAESSVIADDADKTVLATLSALDAASTSTIMNDARDALAFETVWTGRRREQDISYTRTFYVGDTEESFHLIDEVLSGSPISELQVSLRPASGISLVAAEAGEGRVDLAFAAPDGGIAHLRVEAVGQQVVVEQADDGRITFRTPGAASLHLRFTAMTTGAPVYDLAVNAPHKIVDEYRIGAMVLREGDSLAARMERLTPLGFTHADRVGPYVFLTRETLADADSSSSGEPNGSDDAVPATGVATPTVGVPLPSPTPPPVPTPTLVPLPVVSSEADLAAAVEWIAANSAHKGSAVLVGTAPEGEWLERVGGLKTLYRRLTISTDQTLEDRGEGIAAEALLRSTAAVTSAHFLIKYIDRKTGPSGDLPRQPWIAVNHQGQYLDLLRILPSEVRIIAGDAAGGVLATLNALDAADIALVEDGDSIRHETRWTGARRGGQIAFTQTLVVTRDATSIDLINEVVNEVSVSEVQADLRAVTGLSFSSVEVGNGVIDLFFPPVGSDRPHVRVTAVGHSIAVEVTEDGRVTVRAPGGARLHLRFTAMTVGAPVFELNYYSPKELVDSYKVGTALLMEDAALESRVARLAPLGFSVAYQAGPYVVLVYDAPLPISSTKEAMVVQALERSRSHVG